MVQGGFTPRPKTAPKWDPIKDIARYNCPCGRWIMLAPSRTEDRKLKCTCGRLHYWKDGEVKTDEQ